MSFDFTFDSSFDIGGAPIVDLTILPTGWVETLAFGRMPLQFRDKPIIMGILACVLPSVQALENTIADVIASRNANTATGQSLTNLGKLVGLPRITLVDDDFRRYVRAQIAVNKSLARYVDILNVAVLVLGDASYTITLHQEGTATARLTIGGKALTDTIANILTTLESAAVAVGVRLIIQYSNSTPVTTFTFNIGPGFNQGALASGIG